VTRGKIAGMATRGMSPPQTSPQKRKSQEQARSEQNKEFRTARCAVCRGPRDPASYPIHNSCCTRTKKDGVVTWRPYLSEYFFPEESISA
jgi:hypothetical protein